MKAYLVMTLFLDGSTPEDKHFAHAAAYYNLLVP
jgi:hypothetical protein